MRSFALTAIGLGALLAIAAGAAGSRVAGQGQSFACDLATLRGTYGTRMEGTRPVPPSAGGGFETVIGVVVRTYDGEGSFTQIDNIKGSVTGIVLDRPGFGTYHVNADCTGSTEFSPGPGVSLQERMVILEDGHDIRSIVVSPQPVMITASATRIDRR